MANVLLIEPFYSGSHKYWADGVELHSNHNIELLTLPGESWRQRLRSSAPELASMAASSEIKPDAILVSGMTNVAELRAFLPARLSQTPMAIYMHENQLGYPGKLSNAQRNDFAKINLDSMLAADKIFTNSQFHKTQILELFGDVLNKHAASDVAVLPVGIETAIFKPNFAVNSPPLILWNQRWEFDKNPEHVFCSLLELANNGNKFDLALLGENQKELADLDPDLARLGDRVRYKGYLNRADYVEVLNQADIVVSAADHEYFGVSVVEAMLAGCVPVLPNRLSYPELIPEELHDKFLYEGELSTAVSKALENLTDLKNIELGNSLRRFGWNEVAELYDTELTKLCGP